MMTGEVTEADLSMKMKIVELRAELSARKLDTKGTKAILVKRLLAALNDAGGAEKIKMTKKICLKCRLEVQNLMECSRCRIAGYCSQACQKAAFKDHKKLCMFMSDVIRELCSEESRLSGLPNPMPCGEFSWAFVRDVMCNNASTRRKVAPEYVMMKLQCLKEAACLEGNLMAAKFYVQAEWIYRHKYSVLRDDSSVVDLPLMLLALGRVAEAENVIKKVFMDFLKVKPCPENPPEDFFCLERYVEATMNARLQPRHPSMFYLPFESSFLLVCYGAFRLMRNRPAFKEASDTVHKEISNEESFFNKLQGKDAVVEKILGNLERDMVNHWILWTEDQAGALYQMNQFMLRGIISPFNVLQRESDFMEAYKNATMNDLSPKWRDIMVRSLRHSDDEIQRDCAKLILLGAMLICKLAGLNDTLQEIASRVLMAAA